MQGNVTGNGQRAEAAKKIVGLDSKGRLFQWADELVELVNQLCAEYESWCEEQKVPYIRMDDQDAKGYYLTQAQRAELATFRERWNALDQAQVDSRNRSTSMKLLQNPTTANATEKNAMTDHVIRYVVTHINKDGMRTLCGPAQGRLTKETAEEAQALLDAIMKNNRMEGELLAGVYGLPLEVRPVKCYPGHFDPMSVYFDTDDSEGEADRPIG